jgi:hypothetical protein
MRLYKVSPPRASMVFEPSTFWRSEDWESSTTRRREGYVEASCCMRASLRR